MNWNGLKSFDGKVSEAEFNRLIDAVQAHSLRPGTNYRLTQTVAGITLTLPAPHRIVPHPFQLLNASDEAPKLKVFLDSWVMGSRSFNDKVTITGLDSAFEVAVGEYIWIEIPVTDGEVSGGASIQHSTTPWASYPLPYDDVATQTKAFYLIGYTQAYPGDGTEIAGLPSDYPWRSRVTYTADDETLEMQIVQCLTTNLIITEECEETDTVLGFAPWSAIPSP